MTVLDGRDRSRPLISDSPGGQYDRALDEYFLASRSLSRSSVVNLLLSAAFGINAVLYAAWLGYLMGLWAIGIQVAWSLSYILLARFATTVSRATSLHDFLGRRFGIRERRAAAVCSIIGLTYFVGWEVSIARVTLTGVVHIASYSSMQWLVTRGALVVGLGAGVAILYSSVFGRRADAHASRLLNFSKSLLLVGCVLILTLSATTNQHSPLGHHMWSSLPSAVKAVGLVGLLTSLAFNIAWQFVDNSSWQSFNSGRAANPKSMSRDLRQSAWWTFLTVNLLSTLIGCLMRGVPGITSNNILTKTSQTASGLSTVLAVVVCCLVLASMISLVDVIVLAIAQALVVDVGLLRKRLPYVRRRHAQVGVLCVGICAAWGVEFWVRLLGGSIFNFVYIVIVAQLSLIGPVLVALLRRNPVRAGMWLVIIASCVCGMAVSVIGSALNSAVLVDGAGALTVVISLAGAAALAIVSRKAPGSSVQAASGA